MDVIEVDPSSLEIDPLNERKENVGPHKGDDSLEESIRKQGLIEPPIVRPHNGTYKVIVGQRRTLAAQSVGVDKIPVIVADWDDEQALEATITENADVFRKPVSKKDRAAAISKLLDLTGLTVRELAENMGVSRSTVRGWMERARDEWKDTSVHVDSPDEPKGETKKKGVDKIPDSDLATIRAGTESTEERESVVEKVAEKGLRGRQIREASKIAKRQGKPMEKVIDEISTEDESSTEGELKVETRVTFTGKYAEGLTTAARELGTSEEDVVRQAIDEYLSSHDYI